MDSIPADESSPEEWVWVLDLLEDKVRVGVNRNVESSEDTYKLGENVATLFKAHAEDVGVDLFDFGEVGAAMENRDEPHL